MKAKQKVKLDLSEIVRKCMIYKASDAADNVSWASGEIVNNPVEVEGFTDDERLAIRQLLGALISSGCLMLQAPGNDEASWYSLDVDTDNDFGWEDEVLLILDLRPALARQKQRRVDGSAPAK